MRRGPVLVALAALVLLLGAAAVCAQRAPDAEAGANATTSYGATPEALRPYRLGSPPYWRFYQAPAPDRGARRQALPTEGITSVRIGLIVPSERGAEAGIGRSVRQGVQLCVEQANAAGGFAGLPFELVIRDDSGAWGGSGNTLVELAYEERVWAVIGSVDAASTHVALRVALKAELPMVNTACTDPTLTETAIPWILRCYPDDRQHGYRLASHVFTGCRLRRVAVMRSNDKYGRMGVAEFVDAARRLGQPIVTEVRYAPGERNFETQLARISAMQAGAVVLWSSAADAGAIVSAMRAAGMDLPVFGTDRLVSPEFLAAAGDAAEGVTATSALDLEANSEAWERFRSDYAARFGEEPDAFAAFSYDGARILFDAVGAAGLNRVRIRDQLAALQEYAGVSGPMRFDPTHNNLGRIHVVQVRDGRFVAHAER